MYEDDSDSSTSVGNPNCTDETRLDFYKQALIAKIAHESAAATAGKKLAQYRSVLKEAAKAGVDSEAIANQLKVRFQDPDDVLRAERERLKMMELTGFIPGLLDKLTDGYNVYQPTRKEQETLKAAVAYDEGHYAGRRGHSVDGNPHSPGSQGYVRWREGWHDGQAAIAAEMAPGAQMPPANVTPIRKAPKKVRVPSGNEGETIAHDVPPMLQ